MKVKCPHCREEFTLEVPGPAPIGAETDEPIHDDIVVIDLDEEIYYLDGAVERKENITAICPSCSEPGITQEMSVCPSCRSTVIWEHSTVWKKLFGDPKAFKRTLQQPGLLPTTPLEVMATSLFGAKTRFSNITEARKFRTLQNLYPAAYITNLMNWARAKHIPFSSFESAVRNENNLRKWKGTSSDSGRVDNDDSEKDDPDEGWGNPWEYSTAPASSSADWRTRRGK